MTEQEHRNEYIYARPTLLQSKRARRTALIAAVALLAILLPVLLYYGSRAKAMNRFLDALLTVESADLADPQETLRALKEVADAELVDRLAGQGDVPAVALHESGLAWDVAWERQSLGQVGYVTDSPYAGWPVQLGVKVKVADQANHLYRTSFSGAVCLQMERRGVKWIVTDVFGLNWDALYPAK